MEYLLSCSILRLLTDRFVCWTTSCKGKWQRKWQIKLLQSMCICCVSESCMLRYQYVVEIDVFIHISFWDSHCLSRWSNLHLIVPKTHRNSRNTKHFFTLQIRLEFNVSYFNVSFLCVSVFYFFRELRDHCLRASAICIRFRNHRRAAHRRTIRTFCSVDTCCRNWVYSKLWGSRSLCFDKKFAKRNRSSACAVQTSGMNSRVDGATAAIIEKNVTK